MGNPKLCPLLFFLVIAFSYMLTTSALKCYICTDCEGYFNSSHVIECKPKEDKCIKLVLMSGVIDRTCGDKKKCFGREQRRTRRSISDIIFGAPKRRIARGLLPEPVQKEADGVKESSSIHCCTGDECNESSRVTFSPITILPVLLTIVWLGFIS